MKKNEDLLLVGKVQQFHDMTGKRIAYTAKHFGLNWHTCKRMLRLDGTTFRSSSTQKPTDERIACRRRLVYRLASRTSYKGNHEFALYPSASAIRSALADHVYNVSNSTVLRDLHKQGFRCRVRKRVPVNDPAVHVKRLTFAREMLSKPSNYLKRIIFSDEHVMSTNDHSHRQQWVRKNDRVLPRERKRVQNVPRIAVWGAIGAEFKGPLVVFPSQDRENNPFRLTAETYVRRCLSAVAASVVQNKRILQHDGARPHVAASVGLYTNRKNLEVLKNWPPYSPDLNPIEELWSHMNSKVAQMHPTTQAELVECANKVWISFTQSEINQFATSFEHKLQRCRDKLGRC